MYCVFLVLLAATSSATVNGLQPFADQTNILLETSFEDSEGWDTHHRMGGNWSDGLNNGQVWLGGNLSGGPPGETITSWVREGTGDEVYPDAHSGNRYGVVEFNDLSDYDPGFIQTDLVNDPGRLSFFVSKNRRFTGKMKVQISANGFDWDDTGLQLDGWGNQWNGNTDISDSRVWYLRQLDIGLRGDYFLRWLMYLPGDMNDSSFQIDDILVTKAELPEETSTPTPRDTITPTSTSKPAASPTSSPTVSPTHSPTFSATPSQTPSDSPTDSFSPTPTCTHTASPTLTSTPTGTPSFSPTSSPTFSPTLSPPHTPTDTLAPTDSPTFTVTHTHWPTETQTLSPTPTCSPTSSPTPTNSPTMRPSLTNSPTPTDTNTSSPTKSSTPTGTPTDTRTLTATASASPSMTPTHTQTFTLTVTFTVMPTSTDTPTTGRIPDFNEDGIVDDRDLLLLVNQFRRTSVLEDLDGNGRVTGADLFIFSIWWGETVSL